MKRYAIQQIANGWLLTVGEHTWFYPSMDLVIAQLQSQNWSSTQKDVGFRKGSSQIDIEELLGKKEAGP